MLITEKLSISNTDRFLSNQKLFEILYHLFLIEVKLRKKQNRGLFNQRTGDLHYSLKEAGRYQFDRCKIIMICNMIFDFLDWKPYIKTINYVAIGRFLIRKCRLKWDLFRYTNKPIVFNTIDHEIRVLYELWEKGLYFENFKSTPKAIKKLMNLELYGPHFLQKLFDRDFQKGKMQYFSTSRKESIPFNERYYRYNNKWRELETHDDIVIDTSEYEQTQTLHTQFIVNTDTPGTSSPNYEVHQPTTANSFTTYHDDTTGGTITWNTILES